MLPIIKEEIEVGTTILLDKWKAYATLSNHGYIHQTGYIHSEHFIDPDTGAQTQTIECPWRHVKTRYNIKQRGAGNLLERKLIEEWWRLVNPTNVFEAFFNDLRTTTD